MLEAQLSAGQAVVPHVVLAVFGVCVHVAVPLHDRVMHAVDVHERPVPWHAPPEHTSLYVHAFPSSHTGLVVQPHPSTTSSRQ
jgi:hypothetical protein